MTSQELLTQAWEFHPSVVIGTGFLLLAYMIPRRFRPDRHAVYWIAGLTVMFLALVSPLDPLSDSYLFSAHMLQHVLLDFISPAFFILALTQPMADRWMEFSLIDRTERILGRPAVAWLLGILTLWAWHLPALYNATLESKAVHIFEHLTFLITGTILWWPVLTPLARRQLAPLAGVIYLAFAALFNGILGIIFTVSDTPYYAPYEHPEDEIGALTLIRQGWGLDQLDDQKLGGAIMWVGGGVIFLWAIMVLVTRWYRESEEIES